MTMHCVNTSRVLVADDQVEVLEALRLLLKGEGFQPQVVSSPSALMEELKSRHFDIVLMDLNYARDTTSGQEGLDLLSQIMEYDNTLPVIVMTGWGSVELAVEAMRRGVRDFVQKPWENDRLLNILRKHIEQGQVLRKGRRLEAAKQALADAVLTATDLHQLVKRVAEHLQQALHNRSVSIFTRAPLDQAFWATAQVGIPEEIVGRMKFEPDSHLLQYMDVIFDPRQKELPESERTRLSKAGCSLVVPVKLKSELIGFIGLGEKLSDVPFDPEEIRFLSTVIEQIGLGLENLRMRGQEREYEEAREIQQGMLPKQIPQIPGHEISGSWQPASAVGGDYFDALRFTNTTVALCIADVVGKGMPAALLMSNLQAAVKAFASESMQPRDLCAKVNRVICSNIAANKFITFFYCLYDSEKRCLVYANAGHNAPILLGRNGSHRRLHEGGVVLGVFQEWSYEQKEIEFNSGDRIVLFTDGVTEVRDSDGEEFGERRLIRLLEDNRQLGAVELQRRVMRALLDFSGGEFQDDATLIVMSAE
ncbi:MAG TPA: SpoIIE family protein phosphatase [Acidobacteriota bacterium]|nr:SpoIIE family protein phosphatase [Acidobacteriota bacterium]